ncbi:uncharacterized protein LOC112092774 [Morus notabilis]|uniref:uncharacterized protein LOC112092774 n=1 Tax=Morus notabilis TaxID=981085 RepID=UPI000CED5848|nr:uncharacterized protein LOC112092774 [Morus notabilis]
MVSINQASTYTDLVTPVITREMGARLDVVFSETDVKKALFDMGSSKAPGPDGFHSAFFQQNWAIVGAKQMIVTKTRANRLKIVLDRIISESQSAFVRGRSITDNVMVAFEVLHAMKRKNNMKNRWLALKLDMSKAYDRVEWLFLTKMMAKMGFSTRWTSLVMNCLSSTKLFFLLNCMPVGEVKGAERSLTRMPII